MFFFNFLILFDRRILLSFFRGELTSLQGFKNKKETRGTIGTGTQVPTKLDIIRRIII
jgi:hypothetical protein